jgi:hypothetical protein
MSSKRDPSEAGELSGADIIFWLVFIASIMVLIGVWIYFLIGGSAVGHFTIGVITLVTLAVLVGAWRWRVLRNRKRLELLALWADNELAKPTRPRRD